MWTKKVLFDAKSAVLTLKGSIGKKRFCLRRQATRFSILNRTRKKNIEKTL